jgi:hypothetical protein
MAAVAEGVKRKARPGINVRRTLLESKLTTNRGAGRTSRLYGSALIPSEDVGVYR